MKKLLIVLLIIISLPLFASAKTNETADKGMSGHIAFFLFDSDDTSYGVEGAQDFIYYYGNLEAWLKKNNLSYSFNEDKEISITTSLGKKVSFTGEDFEDNNDIGVIIIRPDGSYKMIQGVWTDVDLILEITDYPGGDNKEE